MDEKQFNRLQEAVQWATDDTRGEGTGAHWNQGHWFEGNITGEVLPDGPLYWRGMAVMEVSCDSACCIAGQVVLREGDRFVAPNVNPDPTATRRTVANCLTPDGVQPIYTRAMALLGITEREGEVLFDSDNGLEDVTLIATNLAAKYGHTLTVI